MKPWVSNASPLIHLGRSENIHLIETCARSVYVPDVAVGEIRAATNEPAARAIDSCSWPQVISVETVPREAWEGETAMARRAGNGLAVSIITVADDVSYEVSPRPSDPRLARSRRDFAKG